MIAIDCDGVIANPYHEINYHIKMAGYDVTPPDEWTKFATYDEYTDVPKKFIQSLYRQRVVMKNAIPYADTWHWIRHLYFTQDESFEIITARIPPLIKTTANWCDDWHIPVEKVHHARDKHDFLHEIGGCKLFVEDSPKNAKLAAAAGHRSYLINRSYNVGEDAGDAIRIDSVWEIEV